MQPYPAAAYRAALGLVSTLVLWLPAVSGAEPLIRAGVTSYFVGGASAEEIVKDISEKAPPSPDGTRRASFTNWDVQWRWKLDRQDSQCSVAQVVTVVGASMFVPKLRNEGAVPKGLRERWKKYEQGLRDLENGHKDIAVRAAKEIESSLQKLKAEPTCEALEKRAAELANGLLENFRKDDETYTASAGALRL
jgi:predicted secreted Zn-dependent protease